MDEMRLGLIVRTAPWEERSGREALDVAMAALTLDWAVDLYFIGDGVLQLLETAAPDDAGLPLGLKAWAALPDLGAVTFTVDEARAGDLDAWNASWRLTPRRLPCRQMPALQARAARLLVL